MSRPSLHGPGGVWTSALAVMSLMAVATVTAGCLSCQPLLDVRHCLDAPCTPSPDAQSVNWTEAHAAAWPEIDQFMKRVEEGEHEHIKWTDEKRRALWADFNVTGDRPELIVFDEGEWYRVRVLAC